MDRTVEGYLAELREHLAGAESAVVQDALYDAEEYLRSALAEGGSTLKNFDAVVETHGTPDEIASAYLETERTVTRALRPSPPARGDARAELGDARGVQMERDRARAVLRSVAGEATPEQIARARELLGKLDERYG